jgi:hypothetical protein
VEKSVCQSDHPFIHQPFSQAYPSILPPVYQTINDVITSSIDATRKHDEKKKSYI